MDSVKKPASKDPTHSTQLYLRIAEIHDDTVILKNGGVRAVIECGSVNVNLKSEDEQNSLVYAYQSFLNSLEFPIQIVVRSKKLDISEYLENLEEVSKKHTSELLRRQTLEYREYVRRLVEFADIMEKKFYVVVPYDSMRSKSTGILDRFWGAIHPADSSSSFRRRKKEFAEFTKTLNDRVEQTQNSLENCGISTRRLSTSELIELFYESYNPLTSRQQKFEEVSALDLATEEGIASTPNKKTKTNV